MMEIKTRFLNKEALIPASGSLDSAGYDLYAVTDEGKEVLIAPHTTTKIHTGIAIEIPRGYFGAIFARSGLATKEGLRPANCVGVIDSDYRGEIMVALHNDSDEIRAVEHHERIAQIVFIPHQTVQFVYARNLDETARGAGGFGSTGYAANITSQVLGSAT